MASPVIVSVTPSDVTLTPGGPPVDVVIVASDPDNASGTGTIVVSDAAGNETPIQISVVVNDPLSFGNATGDAPATITKVAETATSATYRFQA